MTSTTSLPVTGHRPIKARGSLAALLRNPTGSVSIMVLGLLTCAALAAPLIAPYAANHSDFSALLQPPSWTHLLGTDRVGRDVFSQMLWGAQWTLAAAAIAAGVAILVGLPAGLMAGYYAGRFETGANGVTAVLMSLPTIVVLLAVQAVFGASVGVGMTAFGLLIAPSVFRLVRTATRTVRNELYVQAAQTFGLSDARIIGRHILSAVRAPLIIQAAEIGGLAIALQTGLEFMGLGDPMTVSWGVMLNDGFRELYHAPQLLLWPALATVATILSLALFANALRDSLETVTAVAPAPQPRLVARSAAPPQDIGDSILALDDLSIAYKGAVVVEQAWLRVRPGSVLGIVGESGSGKTQIVLALLGLLPDTATLRSGAIAYRGKPLCRVEDGNFASIRKLAGRTIGYVPQDPMSNLDPCYTVGQQLSEPLRYHLRLSRKAARETILPLLARVGIVDPAAVYDSYPHQLSGGMAQRVLIAGAIACKPDILIADEPTTALDVTVQAEVLDLLRDLQQTSGMAVVMVTHNLGVVADCCDRVVVMRDGLIAEEGEVMAVLTRPQHPYTRSLLAYALDGKPPRTRLQGASEPEEAVV